MNKDYVKENQRILDELEQEYIKRREDVCLAADGIMFRGPIVKGEIGHWIHEQSGTENELWSNCPIRILYLTKDQNGGKDNDDYWDLRGDAYHHPNSKVEENILYSAGGSLNTNLVKSLYGLVTATPESMVEFKDIDKKEAVKISDTYPFARINCKKVVGGPKCSNSILANALHQDRDFISKQILNLDADIIVCCGNQQGKNLILDFLNDIGYNFQKPKEGNKAYDIWFDPHKNKIAIDAYHLGYYGYSRESMYNDIVKTYHSFLQQHPDFIKSHRI